MYKTACIGADKIVCFFGMILFNDTKDDIEAIIFDMDGVLLDSETMTIECWRKAAREIGIAKDDIDEANTACMGRNIADTVSYLDNRYKGIIAHFDGMTFRKRTSALFIEMSEGKPIPLMPYARECLEALAKTQLKIALASSTRESTVRKELAQVDLLRYFQTITTGDMVEHSKPAPDIYLKAASSLGIAPEKCVAVEDSPNGATSAVRAGIKCILVPDKLQPTNELRAAMWKVLPSLKAFCSCGGNL